MSASATSRRPRASAASARCPRPGTCAGSIASSSMKSSSARFRLPRRIALTPHSKSSWPHGSGDTPRHPHGGQLRTSGLPPAIAAFQRAMSQARRACESHNRPLPGFHAVAAPHHIFRSPGTARPLSCRSRGWTPGASARSRRCVLPRSAGSAERAAHAYEVRGAVSGDSAMARSATRSARSWSAMRPSKSPRRNSRFDNASRSSTLCLRCRAAPIYRSPTKDSRRRPARSYSAFRRSSDVLPTGQRRQYPRASGVVRGVGSRFRNFAGSVDGWSMDRPADHVTQPTKPPPPMGNRTVGVGWKFGGRRMPTTERGARGVGIPRWISLSAPARAGPLPERLLVYPSLHSIARRARRARDGHRLLLSHLRRAR